MFDKGSQERVIEQLSTLTEVDELTLDNELVNDLEISSMDVLFLISSLEEEFKVKVMEKDIRKMVTVGDVVQIIQDLRK